MTPPDPLLQILHSDDEILVVHKPAGLVCHPTKGDIYSSLASRIRLHLGPDKRAHMINRLDRETSGIVVIAVTDDAARQLRKLWERREVTKKYLAICWGVPKEQEGVIDQPIGPDTESAIWIKDKVRPDGAAANTKYRVLKAFSRDGSDFSLLELEPITGRKHQIRIHLSYLGHPIVGDKMYGRDPDCYLAFIQDRLTPEQSAYLILQNQALHAGELSLSFRNLPLHFQSDPEPEFRQFAQV